MTESTIRSVVGTLLTVLLFGVVVEVRAASPRTYGMSFSFLEVNLSKLGDCELQRGQGAIAKSTFLPRYHDPSVRSRVKRQLAIMRSSGFIEVRTILFFGSGPFISPDWFDVDADAIRAGRLLRVYAEDLAEAGFGSLLLHFGAQGTSSPICKGKHWGDCFDEETVGRSAEFITTVRRALGEVPRLSLRFEIGGEQCDPGYLPKLLSTNLSRYTDAIVRNHVTQFPSDQTTISCTLKRFVAGKASIDRAYAKAGRQPSYYQVHVYQRSAYDTAAELRRVLAAVSDQRVPLLVGEASYGDADHLSQIESTLGPLGQRFLGVYFWPLRNANKRCHVDVAPPYRLRDATGEDTGPPH